MKVDTLPTNTELRDLGFETAAYEIEKHKEAVPQELRDKLRVAFEFYRVVEPEHVDKFNEALKAKTLTVKTFKGTYSRTTTRRYQQLQFTTIHNYTAAPPREVLVALKKANELGCFDSYEVATIGWVTDSHVERIRLPDPILFGRIQGSNNRYFIAQWDDDVKIEDILREDQG